jgi:hypothetical protein
MPISKATASSVAPAAKGDLVVGSATNDAAVLGVGSNDQVLTADSSTTTGLKWATPASGGLTLISQTVASTSSGISFTSLGSYKQLFLIWNGLRHSGTGNRFTIRFNNDSSANRYINTGPGFGSTTLSLGPEISDQIKKDAPTNIFPFGENVDNTDSLGTATDVNGELLLDNYTSSTKSKGYIARCSYFNNGVGGGYRGFDVSGFYTEQTAITSIDIVRIQGAGTFSNQGNTTIRLYGIS